MAFEEPENRIGSEPRESLVSSVTKVFAILDLFSIEQPMLTADEIIAALACSRPQGYRYIRDLCDAGFLVRFSGAYRLGARAIELDYIVRESDPLLRASEPVMSQVRQQTGCDVLLTSMVGERIITIHHERGTDPTTVTYSRGRSMPLFRGAGSKVILASLPTAQQRKLFERYYAQERSSVLGQSWEDVRASLKEIRRSGFAVSVGELDPANVGISAPITYDAPVSHASIVLVLSSTRYLTTDKNVIIQMAKGAAGHISNAIRNPRDALPLGIAS